MTGRSAKLLNIIVSEYIKTATPVSSSLIVDKYKLDVSPATIRNEMSALENEGFMIQPHTSAGRIPTELAYVFYLENLKLKKLSASDAEAIDMALTEEQGNKYRQSAKILAQLTSTAVFWAFHKRDLFYTGISNLFSQPEFREAELVYDVSIVIDRIDEVLDRIFDQIEEGVTMRIGATNPFNSNCATLIYKYKKHGQVGLVGILGPMRMDYERNLAILDYLAKRI